MNNPDELKGFGGWLILLLIGTILSPLRTVKELSDYFSTPEIKEFGAKFPMAYNGELVLNVALFCFQVFVLVLMLRKSARFPPMFVWLGIFVIVMPLVDMVWVSGVLSGATGQPFSVLIDAMVSDNETLPLLIGNAIGFGLWIWYVLRSKRVANTFVN